ncbi:hypothetical protein ACJ2A9_21215 [Anaerobacillus sp. MEB173]|uniref:hypothetical protein n=1 Tax=Anaerobacillus sp. MEB173 TaxID=3383345 RepID=UPI003F8F8361
MKKGFSIICLECNEQMILKEDYLKDKDESKLSTTVFGSYPYQSIYFVCSNCGNEIEVES